MSEPNVTSSPRRPSRVLAAKDGFGLLDRSGTQLNGPFGAGALDCPIGFWWTRFGRPVSNESGRTAVSNTKKACSAGRI